MATINITGTIQDAAGTGVQNVLVRLTPSAPDEGSAEAIGGVGIVLDQPVDVFTASDGTFTAVAVVGFRYLLEISAIGFAREFTCPSSNIRFDLLGLTPFIETATDHIDEASGDNYVTLTVKASPITTLKERYDQLVIEKSATIDGSYAALGTPTTLEAGITFYEVQDTSGDVANYYRAHYLNSGNSDVSQDSDAILGASAEENLLITPDELKELYLFGAVLEDDDGNEFPRRMFEHYIAAAADWLAKELDIHLVAHDHVRETYDHYSEDYGSWGWFQLDSYPVIQIDEVRFQYPSMTDAVVIDSDWIVLEDGGDSGIVQIVPGQGNIADVLLIPGALLPMWSGASGRVPGIWQISYRSGFEPGTLPPDLKHIIGMAASIGIFNIAGDLIAGAGIANKSVSIPGLSQNIGTTSSATNSGYGARIIEYQKEVKEALPMLRRYYGKGTRMVVA
ncbi:MAG: hypothetical protein CMB99_01410 [Flavobacteriaceae bacterium]|nr:hypothetical protein [Flavobacteriaceae bacterium]